MSQPQTHLFSMVPSTKIQRSQFVRQWCHKTTLNEALLVPVYVDEVLPGDTFNLQASFMCRLATPFVPVMDNIYMDSFFFFVPNRLIWEHWENFMGANTPDYNSSTDYTVPTTTVAGGVASADVADYMGVPIKIDEITFNSLHLRANQLVFDEWFRDENLQNTSFNNGQGTTNGDGPDDYADIIADSNTVQGVFIRGKRHDYFTSCLPWPQKGPAVTLPLGGAAPVGNIAPNSANSDKNTIYSTHDFVTQDVFPLGDTMGAPNPFPATSYNPNTGGEWLINTTTTSQGQPDASAGPFTTNSSGVLIDPTSDNYPVAIGVPFGGLTTDLSSATAGTINQLRQAFQIQKLYERDARGGTRYTEILRAHFGVISPDSRLQRPEYLGGQSVPIVINPVVQTSGSGLTGQDTPQGNLAAFGVGHSHGNGFVKSFVEHGVIIGYVNIRSDMTYSQGLNKMWSRQTRLDYYWPELSHIGEQAVLNQEIYAQGNSSDTGVFGYQERYAEYRYYPNMITGIFRPTATDTLDIWHLGYDFGELPTLSGGFIQDAPPIDRIVAVEDEPHFIFDSVWRNVAARPMPVYGVPGLIDHF